jgi:hydrogenase-1 operon protein HyaF
MTEHILTWKKNLPPPGSSDELLRLIDMPRGLSRPRTLVRAAEALEASGRAALLDALTSLRAHAEVADDSATTRIELSTLPPRQREIVDDLLGEGEVRAQVGGAALWSVCETVLPGLWRIQLRTADGEVVPWLEVGAIPTPVLEAARQLPRAAVPAPAEVATGAMNATALIAELNARSADYQPGQPNHVINFTLLPITEVDSEVLTTTIGQIPLVIHTEGYGSCRIYASGLRHVWAVQYLNSMGKVILDTLEIGDVPVAARAAREDFADSAVRLAEMLEAYAS